MRFENVPLWFLTLPGTYIVEAMASKTSFPPEAGAYRKAWNHSLRRSVPRCPKSPLTSWPAIFHPPTPPGWKCSPAFQYRREDGTFPNHQNGVLLPPPRNWAGYRPCFTHTHAQHRKSRSLTGFFYRALSHSSTVSMASELHRSLKSS